MVSLETFVKEEPTTGPAIVNRYNMYPSAEINGATAPGTSSGEAIRIMNTLAKRELPPSMGFEWTELSYQEIEAAKDPLSPYIFPLAVVLVFLVLAFQYESWSLPFAIILIVPMCVLSALIGVWLNKLDNNIFTQIGLVVLVGLAAKNAILIVEFAKQKQDEGLDVCRRRGRGVPAAVAADSHDVVRVHPGGGAAGPRHGAGAEMRTALGIAVFSGMLGVTFFGIFLTPVFYVTMRWLAGGNKPSAKPQGAAPTDRRTCGQEGDAENGDYADLRSREKYIDQ